MSSPKERHGKIVTLEKAMTRHKIPPPIIHEIMEGSYSFCKTDYDALRIWFGGAMKRMDALLDEEARRTVREDCACYKTGKRHTLAQSIFAEHKDIETRLAALDRQPYIIGHSAKRLPNGKIRITFSESSQTMRCPYLRPHDQPLSATYCMCCGGHIKYHLETALGVKTSCSVVTTMQTSCGQDPCQFDYEILA